MDLSGKRVIVTGAANGCGAAAVRGMVAAGARVFATDINDEAGQALADGLGPNCRYAHLDISNRAKVFEVFEQAIVWLGGLDALVNAAGNVIRTAPEETTEEQWDRIFDVHCKGTLFTNQAAFPHLKAAGGGTIINFGSGAGIRGSKSFSVYGAAKGAVFAWTRNLAIEWGPHNIRVNAIAPVMQSEMQKLYASQRQSAEEQAAYSSGQGRQLSKIRPGELGDPDKDLAPLLVLLVSDGGTYITGQALAVDGGMAMLGS
jgi:NAD(P)-dependent dehydrogenase (short-subunit alcohol dehydrogenase family)